MAQQLNLRATHRARRGMSTERRWYEPPTPRDWRRSSVTELQRLQSSTSLRKTILDRTSSTPASKTLDSTALNSSSSSGRSIVPGLDKNLLEKNLQEIASNGPLGDPLKRTVKPLAGGDSRPMSLRRNQSLANLNTSYVLKNVHGADVFESVATTPPRPRSSSMTKYAPLPSIASTKSPEFQPPPLIRSRTFDVIDTKMKNLPTVDDSQATQELEPERELELEHPCLVTVNIEGKTLIEFLSHARDGLLRSRPATRYGRSEQYPKQVEGLGGVGWASTITSLNPFTLPIMQSEDTEDEQQERQCEDYQGLAGEMTANRERKDNMTDEDNDGGSENNNSDNDDSDDDDDDDDDESDGDDDDSDSDDNSDDNSDDSDGDDDDYDSDGKDNEMRGKDIKHNPQTKQPLESNEDIHIYFMLPDDSLLLVCTTLGWTLAALVEAVGGMRVGGRRMKVVMDGVQQQDLNSNLQDLGITHNTTVYLLEAGPL